MSSFSLDSVCPPAGRLEYLSPPPRTVALNQRGRWTRAGFLAALLLAPNFLLWIGYNSGEDLRALAAQGQTTTGHVALRG
jgi:hypothetical protein